MDKCFRHDYVVKKANGLLESQKINSPPILIEKVLKALGVMLRFTNYIDSVTVKYRDKYIIFMNPSGNKTIDKWLISIQLGHIYLGHFEQFKVGKICTECTEQDPEQKAILKQEAMFFASEFLIPQKWLKNYDKKIQRLSEIFDVPQGVLLLKYTQRKRIKEFDTAIKKDDLIARHSKREEPLCGFWKHTLI